MLRRVLDERLVSSGQTTTFARECATRAAAGAEEAIAMQPMWRWNDFDRTFAAIDELRRRLDHAFAGDDPAFALEETFARGAFPRLKLSDVGEAFELRADLPGVREDDLKLSVYQDILSLEGERKNESLEGFAVHRKERPVSRFTRSITLPAKIDADKVSASLKDGVLTITMPKAPEAKPKQIPVRAQG